MKRVAIPARFRGSDSHKAFDLEQFLELAQKTRKWLCPNSNRPFTICDLQLDAYYSHILDAVKVRTLFLLPLHPSSFIFCTMRSEDVMPSIHNRMIVGLLLM